VQDRDSCNGRLITNRTWLIEWLGMASFDRRNKNIRDSVN